MKRLDELTFKFLDGAIGEAEVQELEELTGTDAGRSEFLKLIKLESHLQSFGRESVASDVVQRLQEQRCQRVEDGVIRAVGELSAQVRPNANQLGLGNASRIATVMIGIAALAACLVFVMLQFAGGDGADGAIAQLNAHGSSIKIFGADGVAKPHSGLSEPLRLSQGETVETTQSIESAEIVYADGTTIEVLGQTKVRLSESSNGSKQVTVLSGLIQADVAPQPEDHPLKIVTSTAMLEVLGTTLGVEVRDSLTQLEVATGLVAMTRTVDGKRVEVEAGQFATATNSAELPLRNRPFPELPSVWSEDFEAGVPKGWWAGELAETDEGLGVQAAVANQGQPSNFAITTQNAWQQGEHALFQVHDDTVLHIRLQQSEFARITVMVAARAFPPQSGRFGANLFYTKKAWNENLPEGHWTTISIPLADVGWHTRRRTKQSGAPDLNELAAYLIHVTTMDRDAGLIIDRMWVTRGPKELAQ